MDVEITPELLGQILALPEGGKARITVTRCKGEDEQGDWKRIVAISIKIIED